MKHIRAYLGGDVNAPEDPTLQLTITTIPDLQEFLAILNRALNCAPEFNPDWFKLADGLEKFITAAGTTKP